MVGVEVGGPTLSQLLFKRATKKNLRDVSLTAVKSENKSDLQHFGSREEA